MRIQFGLLLPLFLLLPATEAAEQWVFLKDGRVCYSGPNSAALTGVLPDGTAVTFAQADIQGTRTPEQAMQAVDAMLAEMARGKHIDEHTGRFKVLGAAAVPGLLKHLDKDPPVVQLCALYGLQFCWSREALDPVLKKCRGTDQKMSAAALSALQLNAPVSTLAEKLKDLADDPDIDRAISVFRLVEPCFPDTTLKRISRMLTTQAGRSAAAATLSRCFSRSLTPNVLELLASKSIEEQRAAAVALIVESARDEKPRERMAQMLKSNDLDMRQLAAEFFARLGMPDDLPLLSAAASTETDSYVQAALKSALSAVKSRASAINSLPPGRSKRWQDLQDASSGEKAKQAKETLSTCLKILSDKPAKGDFDAAWSTLQSLDQYEMLHRYGAPEPESPEEKASSELSAVRIAVERLLLFAPCGALDDEVNDGASPPDAASSPIAARFVPPISGYFDAKRKSFGHFMPKDAGVFANSVHVGDDCGWGRDLRTVVCIGNGIVRRVSLIPSWGHIVIIEHNLKDGTRVCSLYAHLSSFVYVKPGEVVEAGRKIGTIGRNLSLENGGYGSHLHFGVHQGAFADSRWITGYIQPDRFSAGDHKWIDPQKFLPDNR